MITSKEHHQRRLMREQSYETMEWQQHQQEALNRKPTYSAMHNPDGSLNRTGKKWYRLHPEEEKHGTI